MGKNIYSAAELSVSARKPPDSPQRNQIPNHDREYSAASGKSIEHSDAQTILMASNDDYLRSMTRAYLEHMGFAVVTCTEAVRAAEIASRCPSMQLLLLDLSSSHREGLQVALELADMRTDVAAVIMCGSEFGPGEAELANRNGWKLIRKPVQLPDLLAVIRQVLYRNQLRSDSQQAARARGSFNTIATPAGNMYARVSRPSASVSIQLLTSRRAPGDASNP